MLVILASRFDPTSAELAERWAAQDACVMTPEDLSKAGWRDRLGEATPSDSTAVVGGLRVKVEEIRGVLVRTPVVFAKELVHISRDDREYVATEMTAYLVSWLSRLRCPVLNRPTPMCLSGPAWRPEKWLQIATNLGIPVRASRRSSATRPVTGDSGSGAFLTVTVVGDRCFGSDNPSVSRHASLIAHAAGTELLEVYFGGSTFAGASVWARLDSEEVSCAVLEHLLSDRRAATSE